MRGSAAPDTSLPRLSLPGHITRRARPDGNGTLGCPPRLPGPHRAGHSGCRVEYPRDASASQGEGLGLDEVAAGDEAGCPPRRMPRHLSTALTLALAACHHDEPTAGGRSLRHWTREARQYSIMPWWNAPATNAATKRSATSSRS